MKGRLRWRDVERENRGIRYIETKREQGTINIYGNREDSTIQTIRLK